MPADGQAPAYRELMVEEYISAEEPFYLPVSDEVKLFEAAYARKIPVLLKGPNGWRPGRQDLLRAGMSA